MAENSELIENFESLLRQTRSKDPPILYRSSTNDNTHSSEPNHTITAKDVILSVAKQLKAMQSADCMKTTKKSVISTNRYKKSFFVPVNMLKEEEPPPKKPKFETQPVSDTQLINIIQDVEALDAPSGMTQEFDTSFRHSHTEDGKPIHPDQNPIFPVLDITLKEPDPNASLDHINSSPLEPNTVVNVQNFEIAYEHKDAVLKLDTQIENCTQLLNECVEIENLDQLDVNTQDTSIQGPLSPIFSVKSKKTNTPSLVVNLESFEKFEILAQPVIKETPDKEIARKMINSQIIGKELFIHSDFEPVNNRVDQISPVIELSNEILKVDKESLMKNALKTSITSDNNGEENSGDKQEIESDKHVFKDEILFSSDEEDDYVHRSYQDLPFTCALETSFYDHSDVLDKTMFVGFQTASSKSIQINSDSFSKAKGLFVDIDEDVQKEATLTDLVKICDTNFSVEDSGNNNIKKLKIDGGSDIKNVEENDLNKSPVDKDIVKDSIELRDTDKLKVINENTDDLFADDDYCDMLSINIEDKNKTDNVQLVKEENPAYCVPLKPDETKFEGFKTASNKIIALSEKKLVQTKKIFQDIYLDENVQIESISNTKVIEIKPKMSNNTEAKDKSVFSDEEDIFEVLDQKQHLTEISKMDDDIFQEFQEEMAHEDQRDTEKDDKTPELIDFKTANNKNIKISDAALAKTKNVFQDIDLNDQFNIKSKDVDMKSAKEKSLYPKTELETVDIDKYNKDTELKQEHVGFKTASNKNIAISEKALSKMKNIFSDIEFTEDFKFTDIPNSVIHNMEFEDDGKEVQTTSSPHDNKLSTSNTFAGFRTANNKEIKITNQAFLKTKHIFQDINLEFDKPNSENVSTDFIKAAEKADSKDIAFPGFKTASNKKVSISAKALARSKKVFGDIEDLSNFDVNENKDDEAEPPFYGFEQAENDVALFEKALAKSQKIFEKLGYHDDLSNASNKVSDDVTIKDKVTKFQGFQTASIKPVTISAEALDKTKNIFNDIDIMKTDKSTESTNNNSAPSFGGFKTASNKDVTVSMAALKKSKKIFQDIDKDDTSDIYLEKREVNLKDSEFKGFFTASNKNVKISKEALAKSKKFFQDINEQKDEIESRNIDSVPTFRGFQTASNKEVKVSKEALAKSRKLFQDIDKESSTEISDNDPEKSNALPAFKGFQTANNKEVKISKEVLAKSRKIFQEIEDENFTNIESKNLDSIPKFKGFQTASNKEARISEEALAKSKKIFQDFDEDKGINKSKSNFASFKGFQTASNKEVKVSKEALAKCKKIFQDLDEEVSEKINVECIPHFKGFQTASNRQVKISKEALEKSKKIFQDIDDNKPTEINDLKNTETLPFKGFHTASNKKVQISGTALLRSRKIFESLDLDVPVIDEEFNEHSLANKTNKKINDFGFKTAADNKIEISKEALLNSRKLFSELDNSDNISPKQARETVKQEATTKTGLKCNKKAQNQVKKDVDSVHTDNKDTDNIYSIINTQVLNNFEMTLNTEDFSKDVTPKKSKRSGSPILSCPKAKRRKVFQTPYSQKVKEESDPPKFKPPKASLTNVFKFDLNYKKTKIYTLKDVEKLEKESSNPEEKTDPYISNFTFENLLSFKFSDKRNDVNSSTFTSQDLKKLFLDSVNKKLVPEGWIDIHLKLILFKLLSYEMKFPKTMSFVCTARNVIEQLKYRYDKELYNAERPALRKIMEKDDIAMKILVLCVVDVYFDSSASGATNIPNTELLLSDGWYCIRAVTDRMLAKLVHDDKIRIGTKLVTHGAELVGSEQAVSPWEDTSTIRLKLSGNSTRRARWHARLGYHGNGAILSQLSNVAPDGGKVSKLRVYVTRVYPALYIEKFEDGSTVTRSERLESLHQMRYETERQMQLEKIYEEVEKEIYDQESQDSEGSVPSGSKRKCLDSGSQIAKMMKTSRDPAEFRSHLTPSQTDLLAEHTSRQRERQLQAIQNKVQDKMANCGLSVGRNVVPLLKIRVAGVEEKGGSVVVSRGLLSIWKPNDALVEMIREGTWIEVMNVTPTALRYGEIQISAGRQSVFSQSKYKETEKIKPYLASLKRTCYPIKDLIRNPAMTTDYNEIDTAGIIFEIDPSIKEFDSKKHQFQNVFLTDGEKNIICVNFWGGVKKFGFDILDTGQVIAGMNLQKRAGNSRKNIPHYRVTEFSYFTKTPKNENARKIVDELSKTFFSSDRKKFIEDCINVKNNYSIKLQSNENISPYRFPNMDLNLSKNKAFLDSPLLQKSNRIEENVSLTGLDFESTFRQTDTQELSPRTLMRKKQVKEKIAKLKRYGEPPPLSPMQIINKSNSAYKSPLISKSDVSKSVASDKKILPNHEKNDEDIQCSPVICMNRTYVKRTIVNPVKLNFSSNVAMNESSLSEIVDEFAEEFDGSPPLSLD